MAIVAPFLWLACVPATYPVWLRHLTGMFRDCCGLGQDLAPRAIIASAVVDLGIIGAAVILLAGLADGGLTVCRWPEHSARAAEVAEIVSGVRAGWEEASVSSPSLFTEADPAVAPADALVFTLNRAYTEDEVIASLATGMLA